jgi:hypothetical protein
MEEGKHEFTEIKPSWTDGQDLSSFRKNEMKFFLNGCYTDIWQGYVSADPSISWDGRKISFGLLIPVNSGSIFYHHDPINGVESGQIYFLKLKLMMGIYGLPVAFIMINVDEENKIIEFSYIEENKSIGVQQLKFLNLTDDLTEIIHTSYYKSDSKFRDRWMYPYFHKRIVNNFHRNMRKMLNKHKIKQKQATSALQSFLM